MTKIYIINYNCSIMTRDKEFYESVGKRIGWDFSKLESRVSVKNQKWDFMSIVRQYVNNNFILLDLGTGSGEKILPLAKKCKRVYGIDNSKSMIARAKKNALKLGVNNVQLKLGDINHIPFASSTFDIVISRHSPINFKEACRVLKKEGLLITQQVGERDKQNIKDVFGRGQSYGKKHGELIDNYVKKAQNASFKVLGKDHYHSSEYYKVPDLIFLLENTPIIPGFNVKKDINRLQIIKNKFKSKLGIRTNSCRYLLVLKKM